MRAMRLSWMPRGLACLACLACLGVTAACGDDGDASAPDAGDAAQPAPDSDAGRASAEGSSQVEPELVNIQRKGDSSDLRRVSTGPAVGRRLSREEYFNSIESTLGVVLDRDAHDLPVDARSDHGFRNAAQDMLLTQEHIQAYFDIGHAVAQALDVAALVAAHAPCPEQLDACFEGFINSFGPYLLRGPVAPEERDGYMAVFDATIDSPDQWQDGVRLLVQAMLQSPRFVYRLEHQSAEGDGDTRQVSPYELATRLSFLIWNAAPDAELIELAAASGLDDAWDAQVERLLEHAFARRALEQYVEQWLHLNSIPSVFTLSQDMQDETYRLFDQLLWEQQADIMSVFTSQRVEISGALASFYGLDSDGDAVQVYDVSMFPYRSGFLSNAGVIVAHTINPSTSMIDRGLFMLHDVLCEEVAPPSGEALQEVIAEEMIPASSGLSQRERFAMQRDNPLCAGCHGTFDPLGEAFEIFDGVGRHVTEDEHGNPLTGHGHIQVGDLDTSFEDFQEFTEALQKSRTVERCMVEKSIQHAFGRALAEGDQDLIDEVHAVHEGGDRSYRGLLRAIANHASFRAVEVAE